MEASEAAYERDFALADRHINALVFNAFIWCQLFNEINARRVDDELNVFENLTKSRIFMYVLVISAALQVTFMQVLFKPFHVLPLSQGEWIFSISVGAGTLLLSYVTKVLTARPCPDARVSPKKRD